MAQDRYIRNKQRDVVRAQSAAAFDLGTQAMRITWQQQNSEHLQLVQEALARPELYPETRTLLEQWQHKLMGNKLNTLTTGRLAFLRRLKLVERLNTEQPDRARPPLRRRGFGPNPNFEMKRADWLEDPALLPKKPPGR